MSAYHAVLTFLFTDDISEEAWIVMVAMRFRKAISAFAASVIPMIAIGGAVLGVARPAVAGNQEVRVTGFTIGGSGCKATFTQNPPVIKDVTNVNIKIGGPIG